MERLSTPSSLTRTSDLGFCEIARHAVAIGTAAIQTAVRGCGDHPTEDTAETAAGAVAVVAVAVAVAVGATGEGQL